MTWIETIDYTEARGKLKKLYDAVKAPNGQIDNILKAHSLRPSTLDAHLRLYKSAVHMNDNELSGRERELVAVCVSLLNRCDYCVKHHTVGLSRCVGSIDMAKELAEQSTETSSSDKLTEREIALCRYAKKFTLCPSDIDVNDIEEVRSHGLSDAGILDLNQVVAYFNYANRTVLGLGITTEGEVLGLHPESA